MPLIIRGPGIARDRVSDVVTSHTDLAPTFLELAGGKLRDDFDDASIPLTAAQQATMLTKAEDFEQGAPGESPEHVAERREQDAGGDDDIRS